VPAGLYLHPVAVYLRIPLYRLGACLRLYISGVTPTTDLKSRMKRNRAANAYHSNTRTSGCRYSELLFQETAAEWTPAIGAWDIQIGGIFGNHQLFIAQVSGEKLFVATVPRHLLRRFHP
jgi:hypothetical protein